MKLTKITENRRVFANLLWKASEKAVDGSATQRGLGHAAGKKINGAYAIEEAAEQAGAVDASPRAAQSDSNQGSRN